MRLLSCSETEETTNGKVCKIGKANSHQERQDVAAAKEDKNGKTNMSEDKQRLYKMAKTEGGVWYLVVGGPFGQKPDLKQQQHVGKVAELQHVVVPALGAVHVEAHREQDAGFDGEPEVPGVWTFPQPECRQPAGTPHMRTPA